VFYPDTFWYLLHEQTHHSQAGPVLFSQLVVRLFQPLHLHVNVALNPAKMSIFWAGGKSDVRVNMIYRDQFISSFTSHAYSHTKQLA